MILYFVTTYEQECRVIYPRYFAQECHKKTLKTGYISTCRTITKLRIKEHAKFIFHEYVMHMRLFSTILPRTVMMTFFELFYSENILSI